MYCVKIKDKKQLLSFLRINDIDTIDAYFVDDKVTFISNTNDVYAELELAATHTANDSNFTCRIAKNLLASMEEDDYFEIRREDSELYLYFYGEHGDLNYTCIVTDQVVAHSIYQNKRELANSLSELVTIDSNQLTVLQKIAKLNGGLITIDNSVASVILKEGPRIYQNINSVMSFAMTSSAVTALRSCNRYFGCIKNFLVATNAGFKVIVRQSRFSSNAEYEYLKGNKFGAKFTSEINLAHLFHFLSNMKLNISSITIDTNRELCTVETGRAKYAIPCYLMNKRAVPTLPTDEIKIPISVLQKILFCVKSNIFQMRITANFIQLQADDFLIVW